MKKPINFADENGEDMNYPIGIQTFEKIRNSDFAYVDKTAHVYRLASQGSCYFLSRPRRFGKSLLLSTLKSYFQGNKKMFEGLAISKLEKDWRRYPVLHLEVFFQNSLMVLFKLMGFYVQAERHTSHGRMDVTLQTKDYVYILELKVDKSADEALQQIEEKQYAAPFAADPRKLFKIGVCFSSEERGIDGWRIKN